MRVCIVAQATDSLYDDLGMGNPRHRERSYIPSCYSQEVRGVTAKEPLAVGCCAVVGTGRLCCVLCCTVLPRSFVPS